MASGSLSPRQKMINMMYLVLTALLALNVSKEVLNSFFEVNLGIVKSAEGISKNNDETYAAFENATNQNKVKNHRRLAEGIRPEANELVDLLQEMKYTLVLTADNQVFLGSHKDEDGEEIEDNIFTKDYEDLDVVDKKKTISFLNAKDDRHASGDIFNPENKSNLPRIDGIGKATLLKDNILEFRDLLLSTLYEARDSNWVTNNGTLSSLIEEINTTLGLEEGEVYGEKGNKRTWEYHNFYDMPAVGVHTILSKWQADVRTLESSVIRFLAANIDASSLKFTGAEATTIPASSFILKNEEFQSKIFLTAFDKSSTPTIFVFEDGKGDYEILEDGTCKITGVYDSIPVENGKGTYTVKGSSVGPQPYKGFIKILQDEGYEYYPFNGEYVVANSSYAISPTKMNVMYHNGFANPLSVSVAGYLPEDVDVKCSGGRLKTKNKKKGEYEVIVTANHPSKVKVSLSVRTDNGIKKIGFEEFRIKYAIGNVTRAKRDDQKNNGEYSKNEIKSNEFWSEIPDFDFPVDFYVAEFEVKTTGTQKVTTKVIGNKVNSQAKREIDKLEPGQTVVFQNFLVRQDGMENNFEILKDKYVYIIK